MKKPGTSFKQNIALMVVAFGIVLCISGTSQAQAQAPIAAPGTVPNAKLMAPDSVLTTIPILYNGSDLSISPYSGYRLNLTNGLSIRTGGRPNDGSSGNIKYMQNENVMDGTTTNLNPNNFRRGNFIPREALLDFQHFTLGASYNYGLSNMLKSGGAGGMQNSRNPGLSLHAGFSF